MSDYLPDVYVRFRELHPDVAEALDRLGAATEAGPLDERSQRLVKLGIAIGAEAEGAVRSNVRKGLAAGLSVDEIYHATVLAITTAGFPAAIAAMRWVDQVVSASRTPPA
jgi:4-carboxymuconolactone decarboxylase